MIDKWLEANFEKLVEIRRWLHSHPEVGFDEHETTRYCQNLMRELGLDTVSYTHLTLPTICSV